MKEYTNCGTSFGMKAAYDLDCKTNVKEFSEAYLNLCANDKPALEEWKRVRKFEGRNLSYVVGILELIGVFE
jgi:hypothetical protein